MPDTGIDLSHHNPNVRWTDLALSGIKFVILKATEGEGFVDPMFADRWKLAGAYDIGRGAYAFFKPDDKQEVAAELFVKAFLDAGGTKPNDLFFPLWLDVENSNRPLTAQDRYSVLECWKAIEETAGQPCGIYGSRSTLELLDLTFDVIPPLWLAHYSAVMGSPPKPWASVAIWQYDDHGHVPGVEGEVDLDVIVRG